MVRAKKQPKNDPSFRTMKADYYPVQRITPMSGTATAVDYYIADCGRIMSTLNHRLYRQGKTYIAKVDLDPGEGVSYDIYALVDTWYIQKAWQLARATYLRSTADERAVMSKQQIARWEDFRVGHGLSGGATDLVPTRYDTGLAGAGDTAGEFALSEITLADGTTQRSFGWTATAGTVLGILTEYDKSGDTDGRPSTVSADKPYAGTDPGVHESQMDDLAAAGNAPPYDAQNFNARVWVKIATLNAVAAHGKLSTGFFNAPCGLIAVEPSAPNTPINGQLTLTIQAGDYKGLKAHNMGV
jgi:hypothetical protein